MLLQSQWYAGEKVPYTDKDVTVGEYQFSVDNMIRHGWTIVPFGDTFGRRIVLELRNPQCPNVSYRWELVK